MTNGYRIAFTNSSMGRCIPTSCAYSGNGGFAKKKDTNYCRTDKLTSFGKLDPTKTLDHLLQDPETAFFLGGAVWCDVYVVAFDQSPLNAWSFNESIAGEALLEWWTFECLEPKPMGFGQRIWNSNARGWLFTWGLTVSKKKPCHATCWVDKNPYIWGCWKIVLPNLKDETLSGTRWIISPKCDAAILVCLEYLYGQFGPSFLPNSPGFYLTPNLRFSTPATFRFRKDKWMRGAFWREGFTPSPPKKTVQL